LLCRLPAEGAPEASMSALLNKKAHQHWQELTDDEKRQTVADMSAIHSTYTIAAACGMSVEAVRQLLKESEGDK
jgi:bacterioferritin-associated ferredoxin